MRQGQPKEVLPVGKLPLEQLRSLLKQAPKLDPRLLIGPQIGEDAAVIDAGDRYLVVATDPVTFATDHPNLEKKELGEHKMGSGPVVSRGALISPVVFDLIRDTARTKKIPYSVHAVGRDTSTNADAIHIAREGVATALISVPNRYMHSPNEMISLEDVDKAAALLAETCKAVGPKTDFTAR